MIRHAKPQDIPELVELSKALYELQDSNLPFDSNTVYRSCLELMADQKTRMFLVVEDEGKIIGGIAAIATEPLFSNRKAATEVFYYIRPEFRKKGYGKDLLEAYYYWAELVGCYCATSASRDPRLGKLYESFDAKPVETTYIKELKWE